MRDVDKLVWRSEFNEEWNMAIKEKIEELKSRIKDIDQQNLEMRKKIGETLVEMDIMEIKGKNFTDEYWDLSKKIIKMTSEYDDYKLKYAMIKESLKDTISSYENLVEEINALQKT